MPSYRSLLVLALAAFAMTPVLAAEAATQPLKKNEGRFSSHVELVQRDLDGPEAATPAARPAEPAAEAAVTKTKMGWKMKTFIGTSVALNALLGYGLFRKNEGNKARNYEGNKTAENQQQHWQAEQQAAAAPPGSAPPSSSAAGGTPRQNYGYPPNEYRPFRRTFGRRSPLDFLKARSFSDNVRRTSLHPDLLSRTDFEEALSIFGRMLDKLD